MADCASEIRILMPCPLCGRSLIPALEESSIRFHCRNGHELALGELLRAQSTALKCGLEILLAAWSRQQEAMILTVEEARKHGHVDVAEIFNRHARSLESRIRKVRDAFSQSDSSRLIPVPDPAIRDLSG